MTTDYGENGRKGETGNVKDWTGKLEIEKGNLNKQKGKKHTHPPGLGEREETLLYCG